MQQTAAVSSVRNYTIGLFSSLFCLYRQCGVGHCSVDRDRSGEQFLLAGSATPVAGATEHSGAGRIGRLRMRPMTLSERGVAEPTVSLRELLSGSRRPLAGSTRLRLSDYVEEIVASGFPGMRDLSARALRF